jgi:UDP-glucose 4-epimerase
MQEGEFVIGVDRQYPHSTSFSNAFYFRDYVDIGEKFFRGQAIDTIIHTAGTSLLAPSVTDPISYYENNVAKTIVFLNTITTYAKQDNGKMPNIIFSSSASIYGDRGPEAIKEASIIMDPPTPGSPYAETMWMKENILADCNLAYGMKTLALRYFNVAGADREGTTGQQHDAPHIIPSMLRAFKNGKKFTMFGTEHELIDTSCRRDYIHVEDVVEAHVQAIRCMRDGVELPMEINVGTGIPTSNKQILEQVEKTVGGKLEIEWKPERPTDIKFLYADTEVAEKFLGFKPQHSDLKTIVDTAWNWHKDKI